MDVIKKEIQTITVGFTLLDYHVLRNRGKQFLYSTSEDKNYL